MFDYWTGLAELCVRDNPWQYNARCMTRSGSNGKILTSFGAGTKYDTMPTEELCSLGDLFQEVMAPRSMLFEWVTGPFVMDAGKIIEAHGFNYVTIAFNWIKCNPARWKQLEQALGQQLGMLTPSLFNQFKRPEEMMRWLTSGGTGYYTPSNNEWLLLARRGKKAFPRSPGWTPKQVQHLPAEVIEMTDTVDVWAPIAKHSRKPDIFQFLIEQMYPQCTRKLEMFARRQLPGWTCVGNEAPDTIGEDIRESLERLIAWQKSSNRPA